MDPPGAHGTRSLARFAQNEYDFQLDPELGVPHSSTPAAPATTRQTLAQIRPGETVLIGRIEGSGSFRRRLLELGLVEGTPITRQGAAPLGDPLTFRVRGAVLALRRADAAAIQVASTPSTRAVS
jgi:ferrous iron transport protein A